MNGIYNFLCCSRLHAPSTLEKTADLLLAPAREFFNGKEVVVFYNDTVHVAKPLVAPPEDLWLKVCQKVMCLIFFPLVVIGALIKLICLKDPGFRAFCAKKIPAQSTSHPKLIEMFRHLRCIANFASESQTQSRLIFEPLDLFECRCSNGQFHRLRSSRRDKLENGIVQRLKETNPDKNQSLSLLSMGSGGLMSDFLMLEKLVLEGFKNISIDCVDPIDIDRTRVERIRKFFADYSDVTVQIQTYKTIDEIPAGRTGYAALLAVDYDSLSDWDFDKETTSTGDLMKAYRRLGADGFMGLGFSYEDTLSGPQLDPLSLGPHPSLIHTLATDLTSQLPEKEELTVGLPRFRFIGNANLFFLSLALAVEKSGKNYRKISLSCHAEEDKDKKPLFQAMMQALFPKAAIEISFQDEQNKQCDLLFTGLREKDFISKQYLSFLRPQAITYILYPYGKIQRQNNAQENQRVQILSGYK